MVQEEACITTHSRISLWERRKSSVFTSFRRLLIFFYSLYVLNNLLLTNFPSLVLYKHCQDDDINQKLLERIPRKLCCEVNNNP